MRSQTSAHPCPFLPVPCVKSSEKTDASIKYQLCRRARLNRRSRRSRFARNVSRGEVYRIGIPALGSPAAFVCAIPPNERERAATAFDRSTANDTAQQERTQARAALAASLGETHAIFFSRLATREQITNGQQYLSPSTGCTNCTTCQERNHQHQPTRRGVRLTSGNAPPRAWRNSRNTR